MKVVVIIQGLLNRSLHNPIVLKVLKKIKLCYDFENIFFFQISMACVSVFQFSNPQKLFEHVLIHNSEKLILNHAY